MPVISSRDTSTTRILAAFVLATVLIALYWPGLHGGFFFDDEANILLAEGVRMEHISLNAVSAAIASGHSGFSGRAIAQLSFALNHYFSGFDSFAFKATNLAIHAANALLIFCLALRLLRTASQIPSQNQPLIPAALLTAIWLLHPIQITSVLLVVQRMTSLSALFLLSAMLLHLHGRERKGFAGIAYLLLAWGVCWPLSFFSKDTGALFPFFVLAWELIVRRSTLGKLDRLARSLTLILTLAVLFGLGYSFSAAGQWLWTGYDYRSYSLPERLLTEGRVLWFYLALIVSPTLETLGLHHDDIIISRTWLSPWTTLPALAGLASLMWLIWRTRDRAPLVSFGIAWFLIGHGLESTALPLEIAHEHRNYLPLFGILLAGAWVLMRSLKDTGLQKTLIVALAVMGLLYLLLITALRSHQFGDDTRRTQIEAQHHRGSARAQYEAGQVLGRIAETAAKDAPIHSFTRRHFELSMELEPTFKMGGLGMIYLDCWTSGLVERRWFDELSSRLRNTPFAPGDTAIFYSLKEMAIKNAICLGRKDVDALFAAALENPRTAPGLRAKLHSWHADYLWLHERDLASARTALSLSLTLVPANPSNRFKWAQLILLGGEQARARQLLEGLREEKLSATERQTLTELLSTSAGTAQ